MKTLLAFFICLNLFAASDRTLRFESWTTNKSNQSLVITPTGTGHVDAKVGFKIDGSTVTIDDILDEDTMSSDSATALATQQSIKAYVDASVGSGSLPTRTEANATGTVTTTTQDTFSDCTSASITLAAGNYEICYSAHVYTNITAGTNIAVTKQVVVRDSSNNLIADSEAMSYAVSSTAANDFLHNMKQCTAISPTSSTTYKLSFKYAASGGTVEATCYGGAFSGAITDPDLATKIWAKQIQ